MNFFQPLDESLMPLQETYSNCFLQQGPYFDTYFHTPEAKHPVMNYSPYIDPNGTYFDTYFHTPEAKHPVMNYSPYIDPNVQSASGALEEPIQVFRNEKRFMPYDKTRPYKQVSTIGNDEAEGYGETFENSVSFKHSVCAQLESHPLKKVKCTITVDEVIRRMQSPENFHHEEIAKLFGITPSNTQEVRKILSHFGIGELEGTPHRKSTQITSFSFLTEQECKKLAEDLCQTMHPRQIGECEMDKVGNSIAQKIISDYDDQKLRRVQSSANLIRMVLDAYKMLFPPAPDMMHPSFYFNIMTHGFGCSGINEICTRLTAMAGCMEISTGAEQNEALSPCKPSDAKVFHEVYSTLHPFTCKITVGELRRRCEGPEKMPSTYIRTLLKEGKGRGYSENLLARLQAEGINVVKNQKMSSPKTVYSYLRELDAKMLARDAVSLLQSVQPDATFKHVIERIRAEELNNTRDRTLLETSFSPEFVAIF